MTPQEKQELQARFALFVRPTGHGIATRYGVGVIGAVFDPKGRMSGVDTSVVTALTHEEAEKYRREYARQVREGALEQVNFEAYLEFLSESEQKAKAAEALAAKTAEEPAAPAKK